MQLRDTDTAFQISSIYNDIGKYKIKNNCTGTNHTAAAHTLFFYLITFVSNAVGPTVQKFLILQEFIFPVES
jgi:hypothetical protein